MAVIFVNKKPFTASFPVLWNAKENMSGNERFSCEFLVPKDDLEDLNALSAAIESAAKEKWGDKVPKGFKKPMFDGAGTKPSGSEWPPEYRDYYVIRATNYPDYPPLLKGSAGQNLREDPQGASKVFGGDLVGCKLTFKAYDSNGNRGVRCSINQVLFTGKGTPFGGGGNFDDDSLSCFIDDSNPFAQFM